MSAVERPLRILYPAAMYPGGAERQLLHLATHLPEDRFRISFILLGTMTPLAEEARTAGARIHVLGTRRRAGTPLPLFGLEVASRIASYIRLNRRGRYDIVDAWLFQSYGLAAVTAPWTGMPVLISGRRSLSAFKARFGPVERAVDAVARRRSAVFVANSQAVARDVMAREGIPADRIRVIRNGVAIPAPIDAAARLAIRKGLGVPPDALAWAAIGTFKAGKGQDRIVRAFPAVLDAVPDAVLVLAGDGPTRESVAREVRAAGIADRVIFAGHVPDARSIYGALDLLASASEAEGLPNVVLEAAAAGLGIVATDAGGTREIVTDGVTGRLVPVDAPDELARAMRELSVDADARLRLGAAARAHVEREFALDRFVAETAALYEAFAPARRSGR